MADKYKPNKPNNQQLEQDVQGEGVGDKPYYNPRYSPQPQPGVNPNSEEKTYSPSPLSAVLDYFTGMRDYLVNLAKGGVKAAGNVKDALQQLLESYKTKPKQPKKEPEPQKA